MLKPKLRLLMSWFSRNNPSDGTAAPAGPSDPTQTAPPQADGDQRRYKLIHELDPSQAYQTFQKSYEQATGKAWDQGKFLSRANGWRFYGDEQGYVTVREQNSGMLKLTGVAGSPRSILRGLQDLMQENKPTWGMVSEDIARMATRFGFKQPPGALLKMFIGQIPPHVFGGATLKNVGWNGAVTFDYPDVGTTTKFFIANSAYFHRMVSDERVPQWAQPLLQKML